MTFERLEEIARESALQCKHVGCRIHMSAKLFAALVSRYGLVQPEEDKLRNTLAPLTYQLMGVPIICDDSKVINPALWILVDVDGKELEQGTVVVHDEEKCHRAGYKDCQCQCHACLASHVRRIVNDANAPESPTDKASGASTE